MRSKIFYLILLSILCLPAIFSIFKPYIWGSADGLGHGFRTASFYNSLKEGNLRPRWQTEAALGYGAPTFIFNYPLPYYLTSALVFLGFSVNSAMQIFLTMTLVVSAITMYLFIREMTRSTLSAITSGVMYAYAPYHLLMMYLYGSLGEMLAFVFPPLILFIILKLYKFFNNKLVFSSKFLVLSLMLVASLFLFILSHNLSAIMFTPIIFVIAFFISKFNLRFIALLVHAFTLSIVLSAFFWLPAVVLQHEINYMFFIQDEMKFFPSFAKPLKNQFEFAKLVIKRGNATYWDFTLGFPLASGIIVFIFLLIVDLFKKLFKAVVRLKYLKMLSLLKETKFILFLTGLFFVCLFLTNPASHNFYRFPPFTYILYPYRFLFPATFISVIICAVLVSRFKILAIIFIIFAIIQGMPYTKPQIDIFPSGKDYFFQTQTINSAPFNKKNMLVKEFLPITSDLAFLSQEEGKYYQQYFSGHNKRKEELYIQKGEGEISDLVSGSEKLTARLTLSQDSDVVINRHYFPNWQVYLDNSKITVGKYDNGRMSVRIPKGKHNLNLKFGKTSIETVSDVFSISGLIVLVIVFIFIRKIKFINNSHEKLVKP